MFIVFLQAAYFSDRHSSISFSLSRRLIGFELLAPDKLKLIEHRGQLIYVLFPFVAGQLQSVCMNRVATARGTDMTCPVTRGSEQLNFVVMAGALFPLSY